jgi:hypothetical protein
MVDRDEIRHLCFEIYSIVAASRSRQGAGLDDEEERDVTVLDRLFFNMAESELSRRVLNPSFGCADGYSTLL